MDLASSSAVDAPQGAQIVRTRSGSRYRIEGRTVRKLTGEQPTPTFELVDIRRNRLRYTDGSQLFISSPLVAA